MTQPRPIDAMIIGAQKAGTSSLASYLEQHPDICSHRRTEMGFFVTDADYALGYPANYERYFGDCPEDRLLLGKSVTVMTNPVFVARLEAHNPAMRLIAILRNPVDRAYSAYWWARQNGYERRSTFELALEADPSRDRGSAVAIRNRSYVALGRYADQLANVATLFPATQLQVHLFEDLLLDAAAVCRRTWAFLGLQPDMPIDVGYRENPASRPRSARAAALISAEWRWKRALRRALPAGLALRLREGLEGMNRARFTPPPMSPSTRARLVDLFEPDNARLAEMLGRDLRAWSRVDAVAPQTAEDVAAGV